MGIRFRKSLKLAPGVKINVSKSGISSTVGTKGATVNVGKDGAYANLGIPGSGISSRQKIAGSQSHAEASSMYGNLVALKGSKIAVPFKVLWNILVCLWNMLVFVMQSLDAIFSLCFSLAVAAVLLYFGGKMIWSLFFN